MNNERLILKGRHVEATKNAGRLETEIKGLILLMRQYCNPHEPDLSMLPKDEIQVSAERLVRALGELRDLKQTISKLSADLE